MYDENKINKVLIELELKILSSLDDKEYGLIIGLPTIKKYNLTRIFNSQFNDRDSSELASPLVGNTLPSKLCEQKKCDPTKKQGISYSLSNKSANLFNDQKEGSVRVVPKQRSPLSRDHTRTRTTKTQSRLLIAIHKDNLNNLLETPKNLNTRKSNHRAHIYEEDEEITQSDYWDDAWMKDDDKSEEEDEIINLIVSKIVSTDQSFIIEARKFLKRYKDLFSRKLNTIPTKLEPLEIEVDSKKFNVSANHCQQSFINRSYRKKIT